MRIAIGAWARLDDDLSSWRLEQYFGLIPPEEETDTIYTSAPREHREKIEIKATGQENARLREFVYIGGFITESPDLTVEDIASAAG